MRRKKITIQELAKKCGVSTATISRTLSGGGNVAEDTRKAILQAAEDAGYVRPAQKVQKSCLAEAVSRGIELVSVNMMRSLKENTRRDFFVELICGMQEEAQRLGVNCTMRWVESADLKQLKKQAGAQPFGRILFGHLGSGDVEFARSFEGRLVLADYRADNGEVDCVTSDNFRGGMQAADYLLKNGIKKIGWVCRASGEQSFRDRLAGVRARLAAEGMLVEKRDMLELPQSYPGCMAELVKKRLAQGKLPEAFVVSEANEYNELRRELLENGLRVPEDVSVVTFDYSGTDEPGMAATHMATYPDAIGRRAVQLLCMPPDEENASGPSCNIVVPLTLVEADSVMRL